MALTKCPDCGTVVSTEAPVCPKCGRPIAPAKRGFKKISTGWGLAIIAGATIWIVAALVNGNSEFSGSISGARTSSITERQRCEASDFVISHVRTSWETDPGAVTLTAVVTNNCSESAGPELAWTAYYSDGSVAFSDQFWPASAVNIAPHKSYPFQEIYLARPHRLKYTLNVASVNQW